MLNNLWALYAELCATQDVVKRSCINESRYDVNTRAMANGQG